jgi:ADP-heptose:LPS heptosyltransferase
MTASGSHFWRRAGQGLGRVLSRGLDRRPRRTKTGRVLLVKTHALGDILMLTPAVRLFRRCLPEAELIFLTGDAARPLLEGNPHLDRVLSIPEQRLLARRPAAVRETVQLIGRLGCETAVLFHPAWPVHLLARLAGVPRRFGFDDGGSGFSLTGTVPWRAPNDRHYVVDDYLRLAAAAGGCDPADGGGEARDLEFHPSGKADREASRLIESLGAGRAAGGPVGLVPGGGVNPRDRVPEKRWPLERFAALGDRIIEETGRPVWLFGSPGEAELVRVVTGRMKHPAVNFSGSTTLSSLAALIGRTSLLVTVDSAPMHIALALGIPLVGLFGPTRASALLPLGHAGVEVVEAGRDCSPCYNNEPFPGCTRSVPCMEQIDLQTVYTCCMKVLGTEGETR